MSASTLDCSKFSKTALKAMLEDQAFAVHHAAIREYFAPKPKDMSPVEGKVKTFMRKSSISTTVYPKGYVRIEPGQGAGCAYLEAAIELRDHLSALIDGGLLKTRS
jgi:hypothetical protein